MSSTIREAGLGGYRASVNLFAVVVGILLSAWVCYLVLRGSSHLSKVLGVNGVDAVSRIMGFLLICIGVQFGINGITELVAQAPWVQAAGAG
jgi:multiple antibiotic resistance protein